jgi:hypothetical protein
VQPFLGGAIAYNNSIAGFERGRRCWQLDRILVRIPAVYRYEYSMELHIVRHSTVMP